MKDVYVVGTQSQMILAWASAHHIAHDTHFLVPLKLRIAHYGSQKNGKRNWILRVLTPPNSLTVTLSRPSDAGQTRRFRLKARADSVSQARLDGLFGQRWKSETVYAVIKRLFGDVIRSRSWQLQRRDGNPCSKHSSTTCTFRCCL